MRSKQPPITVAQPERDYTALARAYVRGAIAGATTLGAATYLLDPDSGRRRRAELRDRSMHTGRRARELLDAAGRDLVHRARGRLAEGVGRFEDNPNDETLVARVRAQLGHVSSHPRPRSPSKRAAAACSCAATCSRRRRRASSKACAAFAA